MPENDTPSVGGKRILIIEDEPPLAHALELKMKHEGFATTVASTGKTGLQEGLTGAYDLILLDLILPELDGFSILEELRQKGISTAVLVLSNLSQDEDRDRVQKLGAAGYFVKAATPIADIVSHVKSALCS